MTIGHTISVAALIFTIPVLDGCAGHSRPLVQSSDKTSEITVSADPRIELLSVVQYLSDYRAPGGGPLLTRLEFPYKRTVAEHFAPYRDHPAVKRFREMSARGFNFAMPPEAMLSLGNPPELKLVLPISEMVLRRAGGRDSLEAFFTDLRQFVRDTQFMDFYHAQRETHAEMVRDYLEKMRTFRTARDVEDYFGWKQGGYHIILAPFFHPGGFGPRIPRPGGVFDIYNLCGPYRLNEGRLEFGSPEEIQYLIWHEFGHSFVNHLTDAHIGELMEPVTALMPPVPDVIRQNAGVDRSVPVSEWVSEHVIRSVTVRLAYLKQGAAAGDAALKKETGRGYTQVERLCRALEEYERNREKYPTFREFYPEIVKVFRVAAEEKANQ